MQRQYNFFKWIFLSLGLPTLLLYTKFGSDWSTCRALWTITGNSRKFLRSLELDFCLQASRFNLRTSRGWRTFGLPGLFLVPYALRDLKKLRKTVFERFIFFPIHLLLFFSLWYAKIWPFSKAVKNIPLGLAITFKKQIYASQHIN